MIKILTIVGARPQIIKAAALSRAIASEFGDRITEIILHTGQHYDDNMSQVFFDELRIPSPEINLMAGSGSHGAQTARMIEGIEEQLLKIRPDYLVVYGDTNSTLAGAVAASKIHVPIVHIEAGLRSFNKTMPEEINRIMCDHVSTLLFTPTLTGVKNLQNEGFRLDAQPPFSSDNPAVFHCGDVMFDNSLWFVSLAAQKSQILEQNNLEPNKFVLGTIHRDNNTDDPQRLSAIFEALQEISENFKTDIFLPLHPRTSKLLDKNMSGAFLKKIRSNPRFKIVEPVPFLDIIQLEKHAQIICTDSGGVQKESYFFEKPCIILRPQTEWVEIVENGTALIVDADKKKILEAFSYFSRKASLTYPPVFGDGHAARFICNQLVLNK